MRALCLAILVAFSCGCTNLFYQPSRFEYYAPTGKSIVQPQDMFFTSQDRTQLHSWFFKSKLEPVKGLVVQFHGNAENLSSHFLSLLWVIEHGYNYFTFDYRGYGKSKGSPYPLGVRYDGLAALRKASDIAQKDNVPLIVYGQSLGGNIALRAIDDAKGEIIPERVVIESSFLSNKRIAADKLSDFWLTWPVQWLGYVLVSDKHSAKKVVSQRPQIPLLVIHGDADKVVPLRHGQEIFFKSTSPKCMTIVHTKAHAHLTNLKQGKIRFHMMKFWEQGECPPKSIEN